MILENLRIEELPYVMFDDRKELPSRPSIYLVTDSDQKVLYIGRSVDPAQRWASHHKYEALKNLEGVKIAYLEVDESLLYSIEKALIAWFKPPLNEADKHEPKGIEALRRKAGLTQAETAKAIGVDVSTIRNWEKRREGGSMFRRVASLCDLFECSPWDLVEEEDADND
jgi:DNA-binding XRE family transcriptional regulator